jgi:hypothetical protein
MTFTEWFIDTPLFRDDTKRIVGNVFGNDLIQGVAIFKEFKQDRDRKHPYDYWLTSEETCRKLKSRFEDENTTVEYDDVCIIRSRMKFPLKEM